MEHRTLTPKEQRIVDHNIKELAVIFKYSTKKCTNPYCGYPLSGLVEHPFSTTTQGPICDLCHHMEFAVRGRKGLEAAHQQYKDDQARKKKILEQDGKKYFD